MIQTPTCTKSDNLLQAAFIPMPDDPVVNATSTVSNEDKPSKSSTTTGSSVYGLLSTTSSDGTLDPNLKAFADYLVVSRPDR